MLRAVIVTFLPGAPMLGGIDPVIEAEAYRHMESLLARLHAAEPPALDTAVIDRMLARSEQQLAKAVGELSTLQESLARRAAALLAELAPSLASAPTHGDLQPRNVSLDPGRGTVALIDFEKAALAPPVRDLMRLERGVFTSRPALRGAFDAGCGCELEPVELLALRAWVVLESVSALAWESPTTTTRSSHEPERPCSIHASRTWIPGRHGKSDQESAARHGRKCRPAPRDRLVLTANQAEPASTRLAPTAAGRDLKSGRGKGAGLASLRCARAS